MRETFDELPRELSPNTREPPSDVIPLFSERNDGLPLLNDRVEELPLDELSLEELPRSDERTDGLKSLRMLGPSENERLLLPLLKDRKELPDSPLLYERNDRLLPPSLPLNERKDDRLEPLESPPLKERNELLLPPSPLLKERMERLPPSLNDRMELLPPPPPDERDEKLLPPPPPLKERDD